MAAGAAPRNDLRRIAAREIGNPIDLIHGKAAGRAALAKLAAHKDINLIAAELVKVEADHTPVFEQARLELFEPRDQARHAQEHAGGAVAARGQIAAEFCELSIQQPLRLMEQNER